MTNRRGPRRASTAAEVLDAALALLDEGGLSAASIRNIAARVGVAPNAIYTYFPDKVSIQKAIIERLKTGGMTRFLLLFRGSRSRSEIAATFLAVLELCRASVIRLAGGETDCTVDCTADAPDEFVI